jgi:Glycosyl transferase family 64 domain
MSGDEAREVLSAGAVEAHAQPRLPRVLCYINHYYGPSINFVGKSSTQSPEVRRAVVQRTLAAVRESIPHAEIKVCGVPGRSLLPIDLPFELSDPRHLVYASLDHMADQLDRYDWFVNLEDDIELNPRAFQNALEFEAESLPNECLLPNRLEEGPEGTNCPDLRAIPGWTQQERKFRGRTFRVAVNPHSALLMLSRRKLSYALQHIDRTYRGLVIGAAMASAYAHYHRPFSLYRSFFEPEFHSVRHQDQWLHGSPQNSLLFTAILLSWRRRQNLPMIVRTLRSIPQVAEILVWNNSPEPLHLEGASVVQAPQNFGCLPRYSLVPLAKHDNIFFQDDDLLIEAGHFAMLLSGYAADPSRIYGLRGRNLRDGKYVFEDAYGEVDVVLGQSMMFHRKLLHEAYASLGSLPPFEEDDIAFSLSCRRKHRAIHAPTMDLGMSDEAALYRRPDHAALRQEAVDLMLRWSAENPTLDQLQSREVSERARAEAAEARAAHAEEELSRLQALYSQLAASLTVRTSERVKRMPLVYPAYLKAKSMLQR